MKGKSTIGRLMLIILTSILLVIPVTVAMAGEDNVDVVLRVDRANYGKVANAIRDAGGQVRIEFKYTDAIAATISREQLTALSTMPEIKGAYKDDKVSLPPPQHLPRRGYESFPAVAEAVADNIQALTGQELKNLLGESPQNYFPYTTELTRARDFWTATGHFGEGVIVGIVDTGVSSAATGVASRIVGGENFTGDGVSATSPLNGSHGTWVASCVGMDLIVGFGNPAVQNAVKANCPSCVIPDFFGPGIDGILLVGQAPLASFYSLKVFPVGAGSTSRSIIAAAVERAIELKENYNNGLPDAVNIQVLNLSIGGVDLFAGNDPLYAPLVVQANAAGIVIVVSSSNDGPSSLSIGAPGDAKNILTVGATNDAIHERILFDFLGGVGFGQLWRPVNNNLVADFSSRGPTADGRLDPEIAAPGSYRFAQSASGTGFSWVSGTSFSAPTVAGAAALLLSNDPSLTPNQVRAKLMLGADRSVLSGAGRFDQGFGFLDVLGALNAPPATLPDIGKGNSSLEKNLKPLKIKSLDDEDFSKSSDWLVPGERFELFVDVGSVDGGLDLTVTVTPELPPAQQNPLFGDDILFAIHSAKTSSFSDYRGGTPTFIAGTGTFSLDEHDMDFGLMRITVYADWTNVGRVRAEVHASKSMRAHGGVKLAESQIGQGGFIGYAVPVPAGLSEIDFFLVWENDWGAYPTNDLDLLVFDPTGALVLRNDDGDGDFDGLSFDSPERLFIPSPAAGTWTIFISGFTVWNGTEEFTLFERTPDGLPKAVPVAEAELPAGLPDRFEVAQNYPNPFNPSTEIKYQLAEPSQVRIQVFDIRGNLIRTLVNAEKAAGYYAIDWDGTNDAGSKVASGAYVYRVIAGSKVVSKRMMLLK